jgi:hypothetical protein
MLSAHVRDSRTAAGSAYRSASLCTKQDMAISSCSTAYAVSLEYIWNNRLMHPYLLRRRQRC